MESRNVKKKSPLQRKATKTKKTAYIYVKYVFMMESGKLSYYFFLKKIINFKITVLVRRIVHT